MNQPINPVEVKFGEEIKTYLTSVNISAFKYDFFCEGIEVYCQLLDEHGCIFSEQNIFLNKDTLNKWGSDDNFLIDQILIRLGVQRFSGKAPKRTLKK